MVEFVQGGPTVLDGPVTLVPYDPTWPRAFSRHAAVITAALGPTCLVVEHVGSTSVPGLAAKPIIDILLVVPDSADEAAYVAPLLGAGFFLRLREPEWHEHRLLGVGAADVNLHVFSAGSPEPDRMTGFRDRLRSSDDDRRLYEVTKKSLAARDWHTLQDYADAKSVVVEQIISRT
jgi:GrpB-like predicted nucleotidyltransferase (UPF0157 family)